LHEPDFEQVLPRSPTAAAIITRKHQPLCTPLELGNTVHEIGVRHIYTLLKVRVQRIPKRLRHRLARAKTQTISCRALVVDLHFIR
jgi:hypothetical protein